MIALEHSAADWYRQRAAAERRQALARASALENLYEELRGGRFIAKGFAGTPIEDVEIPANHWRLLRFNGDYKEAEAREHGLKYVGITVARAK